MIEKKKTRPFYSAEFKAEAVAKCKKIGTKKTSEELGVTVQTLNSWVRKSESGPIADGKPSYEELERELRRVKKELTYVNEINDVLKKKHSNLLQQPCGRYQVIDAIKAEKHRIPISFLCKHFGVCRSAYYEWKSDAKPARFVKKQQICGAIKEIFAESDQTYGSPRMYEELKERGYLISENTVAKYMREMGLDARLKKKYRVMTTDSDHSHPIAERLFKVEEHHSMPTEPGQVLAGDITYLKLGDSHIYLAVVIDIYTRAVVGWSMNSSLKTKIVLDALEMAIKKVGPDAEVIFHSDRGSQYASEAYRKLCSDRGVLPSMSRRGNCYDNAYVESWFASFKKERLYRSHYSTEAELKAIVFDYIEVWYNKKRKHSGLGYVSPAQFERNHAAQ